MEAEGNVLSQAALRDGNKQVPRQSIGDDDDEEDKNNNNSNNSNNNSNNHDVTNNKFATSDKSKLTNCQEMSDIKSKMDATHNIRGESSKSDLELSTGSRHSSTLPVSIKVDRSKYKLPPILKKVSSSEHVSTPSYIIPFSSPTSMTNMTPQSTESSIGSSNDSILNHEASRYKEKESIEIETMPTKSVNAIYSRESLETNFIPFLPVTSLEFLNDTKRMQIHLTAPYYQILRYSSFLDTISHHLKNDPINFANIRLHSIGNFLVRHKSSTRLKSQLVPPHADIRIYEGLLASELIRSRSFLRKLIAEGYKKSRDTMSLDPVHLLYEGGLTLVPTGTEKSSEGGIEHPLKIMHHEELVQMNFTNLVRYIINLPKVPPKVTDELARHYQYKSIFNKTADSLHALKKDECGNTEMDKEFLLVQAITKVSYDFILLELYSIHILTKFNMNSIIDEKILRSLFDTYKRGITPKVLFFNQQFSAQYAWYFSITIPFIRLIESSVHNEKFNRNTNSWNEINSTSKELASYYNMLDLKSYEKYRQMSSKENINKIRSISPLNIHKPINLSYYSGCLAFISDHSLNLIQCRDPVFQLTPSNYKYVLGQFHRILMKGGYLEFPYITLYSHGKPNSFLGVDFENYFEIIPDFTKTILKELNNLFGKEAVKQSIVVLNPKNEVSQFLISHQGLQMFEKIDRINDYCEFFNSNDMDEPLAKLGNDVHYYIHLIAKKQ